jgi:hypothetical protein
MRLLTRQIEGPASPPRRSAAWSTAPTSSPSWVDSYQLRDTTSTEFPRPRINRLKDVTKVSGAISPRHALAAKGTRFDVDPTLHARQRGTRILFSPVRTLERPTDLGAKLGASTHRLQATPDHIQPQSVQLESLLSDITRRSDALTVPSKQRVAGSNPARRTKSHVMCTLRTREAESRTGAKGLSRGMTRVTSRRRGHGEDSIYWDASRNRPIGTGESSDTNVCRNSRGTHVLPSPAASRFPDARHSRAHTGSVDLLDKADCRASGQYSTAAP